jgi:photosystem II stability/assembly factor-like uncharacterized protein
MLRCMSFVAAFVVVCAHSILAQSSTVFTTVVATRLFVVGAANPPTGLFFQRVQGDTGWHHTGPSTIRAFYAAVFRPSRGRILYLGAGNGVHRSTDGGATWRITTGWDITEVLCVAPDSEDSNRVFLASPYGVYRTMDGCKKWQQVNAGLGAWFVSAVIIDQVNPQRLYCATEDGAYRSDNGGDLWQRMGLSVGKVRTIAQRPSDPATLIVGTEENGIYVTRDGGEVWTKSESGIDHSTFYCFAFDPSHPDIVYAGGYVTGVYKSIDGGRSWKRTNDGLSVLNIHSLAVDPLDGNRVFAAAYWGGIYRSDNGGASWRSMGLSESQTYTVFVEPF